MFFRRTMPFIITLFVGAFSFSYFFMPHKIMNDLWGTLTEWIIIIGGGAMAVGAISMVKTYYKKAMTKNDPNRFYSMVTLFCMVGMALTGFITGIKPGTLFNTFFTYVLIPLQATTFSLLAFYMSSAAFRSFRLKSFSAALLLAAALIVMLAQIPTGERISIYIPALSQWIMDYPNVAAQRAIMIGVSIGAVATALKIILGIEKSVFRGSGK